MLERVSKSYRAGAVSASSLTNRVYVQEQTLELLYAQSAGAGVPQLSNATILGHQGAG